ncbi:MAG TPA: glycosyltransferase family 4 protein [Vicinamibacteria bacterium]|nr:glycosyltransferase family 4 protein [Vicinamibacteria bacterium]
MSGRPSLAFVVQRYGPEVTGGSESLARAVAERLARDYRVTVYTTCARDYVTWRNEWPAGEHDVGGVRVLRFTVEEERDLDAFNRYSEELYRRPHTREEELVWLRRQGPYAPRLVEALGADAAGHRAVVFFTYLYYPTYWGLAAASDHSLLVPTTHDEPPLRFGIYDEVFARARALAFLTPAEEALVRQRFDLGRRPAAVAGMGVDVPARVDPDAVRRRHHLGTTYALYAGRIDEGKGCAEMLAHYARYRGRGGTAELVLIGTLAMVLPSIPGLRHLGYVSEEEKHAAMAGAAVAVCPSAYESLSIALLEAFAVGTPGLVNAASAVLRDHCLRSQAGLYYADADEFTESLDRLVRDRPLRDAMGEAGRRYVAAGYRWPVVLDTYRRLIESAAG